jgi:hypothetical protein
MNEIQMLFILFTTITLLSTMICGLWIRYGPPDQIDESSKTFHMSIALLSIVFFIITLMLLIV